MSTPVQTPAAQPPAAPVAAVPNAPIPADEPQSTSQKLDNSLKDYFKPAPEPAANPAPSAAAPGPEPSPGQPPAAPAVPQPVLRDEDGLEIVPTDTRFKDWPKAAIDTVTALRAEKRESKTKLETDLAAEKQRAMALESQLAELKAQPTKAPEPKESRPSKGDRFDAIPEVKAAREQQAQHAGTMKMVRALLDDLAEDFVGTLEVLKTKHELDFNGRSAKEVRNYLENIRENALLQHSEATANVRVLTGQAERNLGSAQAQWMQAAHALLPELADPQSPEAAEAQQALKRFPWLQDDTARDYMVAALIEGQRVLKARAKRLTAGNGAAHTASPQTTTATAPAPVPGAAASLPAVALTPPQNGRLLKTGSKEEVQSWEASLARQIAV